MKLSLPKWLLPSLATLLVVGGSVMIAGAADGDEPVLDEPVTTTTTTASEDEAPDDDAPESEDPASEDGVERYWGSECGDGDATNHGQYVSSSEKGGASRSEAAHSPCGKPLSSVDVPTTTAPPEDEEEEELEESNTTDAPHGPPAHANGQGAGRGSK